jgi:putative membrane protein
MSSEPRTPRVFAPDDPALVVEPAVEEQSPPGAEAPVAEEARLTRPTLADIGRRGLRWGAVLGLSLAGAAFLGLAAWFARFVSVALARDDWVGSATLALLLVAAFAAAMIVLRELIGFMRLARLNRLKRDIAATPMRDQASAGSPAARQL